MHACWSVPWNKLHEVLDPAVEKLAQAVNGVGPGSIATLIQNFGEGHSAQAGGSADLRKGSALAVEEALFFHHFTQLKPDHKNILR
jgi:hypothetical protein